MELIPIQRTLQENYQFLSDPSCPESLYRPLPFYQRTGYHPPWISYYAWLNKLLGSLGSRANLLMALLKSAMGPLKPYNTMVLLPAFFKQVTAMSLDMNPTVKVTARTLPEVNFSTEILRKNNFMYSRNIVDPEDGLVWEWEYQPVK